jgi:hypothetical protein
VQWLVLHNFVAPIGGATRLLNLKEHSGHSAGMEKQEENPTAATRYTGRGFTLSFFVPLRGGVSNLEGTVRSIRSRMNGMM